ncbi:YdcF family protein [Harryflintia acetispora]|uniref:Uncharacterized SAM-binding protein YcdF (DUF218 family) n=1 Tax=Harryflintia acetispora TaxID=1849041 RepID=A0A9X8Y7Q5_9FIRM|nr:YdcF family protein [Harryflintia acetispora]TCL42692.1 uncharacterized SAM-binding protein YcdF (DUF218 family) [Harryflintia acetispora]
MTGGAFAGRRWLRLCYGAFAAAGLFFGLLPPLLYGIVNPGVLAVLGAGGLYAAMVLFEGKIRDRLGGGFRTLNILLVILLALALMAYLGFTLYWRGYCARYAPPAGKYPQTVIVLGGGIEGERPKKMLARRLQEAAGYLKENPQAVCVVSGGQGHDEDYSEAHVMKKYLGELGIDPTRVFLEERSGNTRENLAFSSGVIGENGLCSQVTVASDGFHLPRAGIYCKRAGLSLQGVIPSQTPWGLLPSYELREMAALCKALLGF